MSEDSVALNKEAISAAKRHMGRPAYFTIILTFSIVSGFAFNLWLFASGAIPAWGAIITLGALTYFAYTPLHEAVHGNINGEHEQLKWLNDACGYLVAPLIAIPYTSHRVEHLTHHRYTNQPDKDPDYMVSEMGKGGVTALLTVIHFLWVQNTFFIRQYWSSAPFKERATYSLEALISLGWRLAFVLAVGHPGTTAVVIILGYLLGGFFTVYWFAYRPHLPYNESRRYRNTSSLIMPGWMKPLEWFWLGQNLHSIHHLFPRVPFYRYHALHREIESILRAQGTPIVGIFSRNPIDDPSGNKSE